MASIKKQIVIIAIESGERVRRKHRDLTVLDAEKGEVMSPALLFLHTNLGKRLK
jgi:hypothetical protein